MKKIIRRYSITGSGSQLHQFIETPETAAHPPEYLLIAAFRKAQISDHANLVFEGTVFLRLSTPSSSGSLHCFQALFRPFEGIFNFVVDGLLETTTRYATVRSSEPILSAEIRPQLPKVPDQQTELPVADPLTGEIT